MFYGSVGSFYGFLTYIYNKNICLPYLGKTYYYLSLSFLSVQTFPVFLLFLVNIFFILGETTSVNLAKFGISEPFDRIKKLNLTKIKFLFLDRFGVTGVFDFFLSISEPDKRLVKSYSEIFYLTYKNENVLLDSCPN